ncbi:MAG: HupE/UreJ family protein [Cyanobacteria bacterium P01_B01_bin.77]
MGQRQRFAICTAMLAVFSLVIGRPIRAHGESITLVELREQSKGNYELKVHLPDDFAGSTLAPDLPDRCQLSSENSIGQAVSFKVLLFAVDCRDTPLMSREKLILPWQTEGSIFTIYWQDGSSKTQFLAATDDGIIVPIDQFQTMDGRWLTQLRQDAISGFTHIIVAWPHLLFLVALAFGSRSRKLVRSITFFMVGGLLSVIVSVGGITVPMLVAETGVILAAAVLAAMGIWRKLEASTDWICWPLLGLGLLHGLGWAKVLIDGGILGSQLVLRLLLLNVGMDAAQLLAVLAIVSFTAVGRRLPQRWRQGIGYGLVGMAVVAIAVPQSYRGQSSVISPETQLITSQTEPTVSTEIGDATVSDTIANSSVGSASQTAETNTNGDLSAPIEIFIIIEPLEIHSEVLVDLSALDLMGNVPAATASAEVQEAFKQDVVQTLTDSLSLEIDGVIAEPSVYQINFVVLDGQVPLIQELPDPENLEKTRLGIALRYPTDSFPEKITVEWNSFSPTLLEVATTINEPHSRVEAVLTRDQPTIDWQNSLGDVSAPAIEAIDFNANSRTIPLVSLALVLVALALDSGRLKLKNKPSLPLFAATRAVLPLAIWAYPVLALSLVLPAPFQPKPSSTQITLILDQLLNNVYESFEFRTEEEIYDKLAISVTGEQLTDIYLENRRALDLENRGGARASVDHVDVTEIGSVSSLPNKEVVVQAEWLARGSVNHFSHTHYRNNLYVALVTLTYADSVWKIKNIEVLDEYRLL